MLYQKQGRNAQFGSAAERDEWLRSEAATLEQALAVKRRSHAELEAQVQQASAELIDLSQARAPPKPPSRAVVVTLHPSKLSSISRRCTSTATRVNLAVSMFGTLHSSPQQTQWPRRLTLSCQPGSGACSHPFRAAYVTCRALLQELMELSQARTAPWPPGRAWACSGWQRVIVLAYR